NALGSLQHGMEVVLLHELSATEGKHVGVNISARKLCANVVGTALSLGERRRCSRTVQGTVLGDLKARQEQALVEKPPTLLELGWTAETDGHHHIQDQPQEWPSVLLPVLSGCDRVVQALPLRVLLVERGLGRHLERPDQVRDLGACDGISEDATDLLD